MQTYNIVRAPDGWAISQNNGKPEGAYITKEGAFEAVYLAASNDIKKGLGVSPVCLSLPRNNRSSSKPMRLSPGTELVACRVPAATPGVRGSKGKLTAAIKPARRVAIPQTRRPCIPS